MASGQSHTNVAITRRVGLASCPDAPGPSLYKTILLTQGKCTIVDTEDYDWLAQHKWYSHRQRNGDWYAVRNKCENGKKICISMHREILQPPPDMETDHRDGNGLNNQRSNLRVATTAQNQHNRRLQKEGTSHFKGVCWHRAANKWCARVTIEYQTIWLGLFQSEIEAAVAYNRAALELFGEYACVNKISSPPALNLIRTEEGFV